MKTNLYNTLLTWVLATSVVLSAVFFIQFFFRTREIRMLNQEIGTYQQNQALLKLLINDTVAYSRNDSNIIPLLKSLGTSEATNAESATVKPPGK